MLLKALDRRFSFGDIGVKIVNDPTMS